jgi:hypothetical protein
MTSVADGLKDSGLNARSGPQPGIHRRAADRAERRARCPAWGTGPAVASDGQAVRVDDVDAAYPQFGWQIANDGSGWSSSRMPIGGSWGTMQPAAANINGEVELLTYWYTGGTEEAILP